MEKVDVPMENQEFTVNINEYVKVKFTEMGRQIWYDDMVALNKQIGKEVVTPQYPEVDSEGYSKVQLWELMRLYGPYMRIGGTVEHNTFPFHTEIILKGKPINFVTNTSVKEF